MNVRPLQRITGESLNLTDGHIISNNKFKNYLPDSPYTNISRQRVGGRKVSSYVKNRGFSNNYVHVLCGRFISIGLIRLKVSPFFKEE